MEKQSVVNAWSKIKQFVRNKKAVTEGYKLLISSDKWFSF